MSHMLVCCSMQAAFRSTTIVILLLLASILPLALDDNQNTELQTNEVVFGTVINTNTIWNGVVEISDNVTVSHGVKLTVKSGSFINITADVRIEVSGTIEANDSTFNSTLEPIGQGNTGTGLWDGIIINSGGVVTMDTVTIANARTALTVSGTSTLADVSVTKSYIGFDIDGQTTATSLSCLDIDFECVKMSGTGSLDGLSATNVSTGVSLTGQLNLNDATIESAGTGFEISGASGLLSDIHVGNASTGWRVRGTTTMSSGISTSYGIGLLLDAGDSSGFNFNNHSGQADRVLYADGITNLAMADVTVNTSVTETTALDVRNNGDLSLTNVAITDFSTGLDLTGDGDTSLGGVSMTALDNGIIASGSGTLVVTDSTITSAGDIGVFSEISTDFSTTDLIGGDATQTGLSWVGGAHYLDEVELSRNYIGSADTTSQGMNLWWADLYFGELSMAGWSTGIISERSTIEGDDATINDGGTSNGYSLNLHDSSAEIVELSTAHSTTAAKLVGDSDLLVAVWNGAMHNTLVEISELSLAQVRNISLTDMSGTIAYGDGELHWGSTDIFTIATTTAMEYLETVVNITDENGAPLSTQVMTGPWELNSDAAGSVTLPLFASGSEVLVGSTGAWLAYSLYGGVDDQSISYTPIPTSGDWIISSGADVVLTAKEDGSQYALPGNITIETGASLALIDTELSIPANSHITIADGGQLSGNGGQITSGSGVIANGLSSLTGSEQGLSISIPTSISCSGVANMASVTLVSASIGPSCQVVILSGNVEGDVATDGASSSLEVRNSITIEVIDAGNPVQGVTISVGGTNYVTAADGLVTAIETSRLDVNGSDTVFTGWKYVQMSRNGHIQFYNWSLVGSQSHTFISSTVTSGTVTTSQTLDSQWSPWFLDADLVIPYGKSVKILDNTEVVIANGITIQVAGLLETGSATLHSTSGSRWVGISVGGEGSVVRSSGSHLVEATQVIVANDAATVTITNSELARGDNLVTVNSGAHVSIENSYLHDAMESCVMAQGIGAVLSLESSTLDACGDHAIWARSLDIDLQNLVIGADSEEGMDFSATTGMVDGIDASAHNGTNAALHLSEINGQMTVANLNLSAGSASAALVAEMSRSINIYNAEIIGTPALELSSIAGSISGLNIQGDGSGTAIYANNSRGSGGLELVDSTISGYSVGLELNGHAGEIYNPVFNSANNQITATTALASNSRAFSSFGDNLNGAVNATSEVALTSSIFDSTTTSITAGGNATVVIWHTVSFSPTLDGQAVMAQVSIATPDGIAIGDIASSQDSGLSLNPSLVVPIASYSGAANIIATNLSLSASADGALPYSEAILIEADMSNIALAMIFNSAPVLQVIDPDDNVELMETENLTFSANASDANSPFSDLNVQWTVTDSTGVVVMSSNDWTWSTTELTVGAYVGKAEVSDPHGSSSSHSFVITISQLDSDGDWTVDCDQTLWWDATAGVDCGPDALDDDDDNDGIDDIFDAWPNDPCATQDSDADGQPDEITCPAGTNTTLIEDLDDNNDGKSDLDELRGTTDDGVSMSMVAAVLLFIAIAALVVNRMRVKD